MTRFCPNETYKVMDEGKAHLARALENLFNMERTYVQERNQHNKIVQREIKHKYNAYPKLNKKVQEHYDNIFGSKVSAKVPSGSVEGKASLAFGFGALKSHRSGEQ